MNAVPLFLYDQVDSTQRLASAWLKAGLSSVAVIANEQTAGRGRSGRSWRDNRGGLSLSYGVTLSAAELFPLLSLIVAYIVREVVHTWTGRWLGLKWPNDLFFEDKKVGGILIDLRTKAAEIEVVCGIGLNINQRLFSPDLSGFVTSLWQITGRELDVHRVGWEVLRKIRQSTEDSLPLEIEQWRTAINEALCYRGGEVRLEHEGGMVVGILEDIDSSGRIGIRSASTLDYYQQGKLFESLKMCYNNSN